MKKKLTIILTLIILFSIQDRLVWTEHRDKPVDIIIAMDKSRSMVEEIDAVKRYINSEIVDKFLQKDDFLLIIAFFGETIIPVSTFIKGEKHKKEIKKKIFQIRANGRYTDIGNALDKLRKEVKRQTKGNRKKTLLLITDGKHEPSHTSKYFSKDGKFSHNYLKSTTETRKKGWKIIVLGIGADSTKELAYNLGATYKKTTKRPTTKELASITPDLVGRIKIKGKAKFISINKNGEAVLKIPIKTKLYKKSQDIIISAIKIKAGALSQKNLLETPFKAKLPMRGKIKLLIPIIFKEKLTPKKYKGNLFFTFSSKESFVSKLPIHFKIKTPSQGHSCAIFIIILVIALLVIALILFKIFIIGKIIAFKLIVEEHPLENGKDIFRIRKDKYLYLNNDMHIFDITNKKTNKSIARLTATNTGLRMFVLEKSRFTDVKNTVTNVLNKSFIIKTETNEDCHVQFVRLGSVKK